ncbi:MAG TPA: mechanosensitive ion channel family protein [Pyrinomonadaceae bacterium]|jgi:small-conductance mechanosensitive channel|nr:mechanosensitive ion channel family protein [Pyrinomonadaceae bacterium]
MTEETDKEKAEELRRTDDDVRRALEQTAGNKPAIHPKVEAKHKLWIGTYLAALLVFGVLYYFVRHGAFRFANEYETLVQRLVVGLMAVTLVLIGRTVIKAFLIEPLPQPAARYNLDRIVNLLAYLSIFFIVLSILFANWYTAAVSLGLLSLVLGFALQAPISSFIGWIYLVVKTPYKVGDRIVIGEATGDVIDVSYLDTTLWEFGGPMISTANHPSGRIIRFPNSKVLSSAVFNYSWGLFPYVWNDIKFQIAYQSDLDFVAKVMSDTAAEEVGEVMKERVGAYRELLSQTPVDELEVRERPSVIFRVSENTWIEAIVRYLVEPRRAGQVKSRLIKKMLERLKAEPTKVMFPKGDAR